MKQYLHHLLFFVAGAQQRERVQNAIDAVPNANPPLDTAQVKRQLGYFLGPSFVDKVDPDKVFGIVGMDTAVCPF